MPVTCAQTKSSLPYDLGDKLQSKSETVLKLIPFSCDLSDAQEHNPEISLAMVDYKMM